MIHGITISCATAGGDIRAIEPVRPWSNPPSRKSCPACAGTGSVPISIIRDSQLNDLRPCHLCGGLGYTQSR